MAMCTDPLVPTLGAACAQDRLPYGSGVVVGGSACFACVALPRTPRRPSPPNMRAQALTSCRLRRDMQRAPPRRPRRPAPDARAFRRSTPLRGGPMWAFGPPACPRMCVCALACALAVALARRKVLQRHGDLLRAAGDLASSAGTTRRALVAALGGAGGNAAATLILSFAAPWDQDHGGRAAATVAGSGADSAKSGVRHRPKVAPKTRSTAAPGPSLDMGAGLAGSGPKSAQ